MVLKGINTQIKPIKVVLKVINTQIKPIKVVLKVINTQIKPIKVVLKINTQIKIRRLVHKSSQLKWY